MVLGDSLWRMVLAVWFWLYGFGRKVWLGGMPFGHMVLGAWFWAYGFGGMVLGVWLWAYDLALGVWLLG